MSVKKAEVKAKSDSEELSRKESTENLSLNSFYSDLKELYDKEHAVYRDTIDKLRKLRNTELFETVFNPFKENAEIFALASQDVRLADAMNNQIRKNFDLFEAMINADEESRKINTMNGHAKHALMEQALKPIRKLIQEGADVNYFIYCERWFDHHQFANAATRIRNKVGVGKTFLDLWSDNDLRTLARILKSAPSPIDLWSGMSPLMFAIILKSEPIVELLLNKGANINDTNAELKTALMVACALGANDIAILLLKAGADVNTVSGYSPPTNSIRAYSTALHLACTHCSLDVVQLIISKKSNLSPRMHFGYTPFSNVIETLIELQNIYNQEKSNRKLNLDKHRKRKKELYNILDCLIYNGVDLTKEFILLGAVQQQLYFEEVAIVYPKLLEELEMAKQAKLYAGSQNAIEFIFNNSNDYENYMRSVANEIFPGLKFKMPTQAEMKSFHEDEIDCGITNVEGWLKNFSESLQEISENQDNPMISMGFPLIDIGVSRLTRGVFQLRHLYQSYIDNKNNKDKDSLSKIPKFEFPYRELRACLPTFSTPLLTNIMEYSYNTITPVYQKTIHQMHTRGLNQLAHFEQEIDEMKSELDSINMKK